MEQVQLVCKQVNPPAVCPHNFILLSECDCVRMRLTVQLDLIENFLKKLKV